MDCIKDCVVIRELDQWVTVHERELEAQGLSVALSQSGPDRPKTAAWLDVDSDIRIGRLTVWESGEANLAVADISTGQIVADEHRQIDTSFGLDEALQSLIVFVLGDGSR
jgi:hypothetical protein